MEKSGSRGAGRGSTGGPAAVRLLGGGLLLCAPLRPAAAYTASAPSPAVDSTKYVYYAVAGSSAPVTAALPIGKPANSRNIGGTGLEVGPADSAPGPSPDLSGSSGSAVAGGSSTLVPPPVGAAGPVATAPMQQAAAAAGPS